MKRTTGILASLILVAGLACAQSPQIIQNTRNQMQTVQNNATAASNQALGDKAASKPAASVHSTAAKKGASSAASQAASQAKTGSAAPAQSKPAAALAKSAGTAAVKPTAGVKSASVKTGASPATSQAKTGSAAPTQSKPFPVQAKSAGVVAVKPAAATKPAKAAQSKKPARALKGGSSAKSEGNAKGSDASAAEEAKNEDKDSPEKKWSAGKRDPFVSPVVTHVGGSGCSTGKKCLEIGAINLRGVVRSENGFIAVVTNTMNKAYFLRENDPVFNGYVVKITDDSVTFKEMLQDRLGKPLTREVVKKIPTPAV
jgi:Tfp pilus assembly protein PilP